MSGSKSAALLCRCRRWCYCVRNCYAFSRFVLASFLISCSVVCKAHIKSRCLLPCSRIGVAVPALMPVKKYWSGCSRVCRVFFCTMTAGSTQGGVPRVVCPPIKQSVGFRHFDFAGYLWSFFGLSLLRSLFALCSPINALLERIA